MTKTRGRPRAVAVGTAAVLLVLAGCAATPIAGAPKPGDAAAPVPPQWAAPLPHDGRVAQLQQWWSQFQDPLLAKLIDGAQQAAPTLAAAQSRIEQARAARTAAGAALLPAVDGTAAIGRSRIDPVTPAATSASVGVQAAWEIDLFGGRRAAATAAQSRFEGSQALWHDARVSVAAEVATGYLALRACEAQLVQTQADATSRGETARLTELAANAGFQPPASAALARASAAQASALLTQQRGQCDQLVKSLVALSAIDEPALRTQLAPATGVLPQPVAIAVDTVPASALAQRPDVYAAARDVAAASADAAEAEAARWPRIGLSGQIGAARVDAGAASASGTTWSIGPLTVSLPIFDAGTRRANAAAARQRYDAALVSYAASLRGAVREVETALVSLQSTAARNGDARIAAEGFERSYRASESRFRGGLASLFELEDARRTAVAAQSALIELQRERVAAWISLYRALGGGWQAPAPQVGEARPQPG